MPKFICLHRLVKDIDIIGINFMLRKVTNISPFTSLRLRLQVRILISNNVLDTGSPPARAVLEPSLPDWFFIFAKLL